MKAVLVFDEMPDKCWKCPMSRFVSEFSDDNNTRLYCVYSRYTGVRHKSVEWDADRPVWCPLKEIPDNVEDLEEYMKRVIRENIESIWRSIKEAQR